MEPQGEELTPKPEAPENGAVRYRQEAKREAVEFAKMVLWFLVLFFVMRTFVVEGYEVQGPSMAPTLENSERILVLKLPQVLSQWAPFYRMNPISEGDIIVFQSPDDPRKRYVKRVIAKGENRRPRRTVEAERQEGGHTPTETVRVRVEGGEVYVNNRRLDEAYLDPDVAASRSAYDEVLLQPGEYYVMGDNRNVSKDSRAFGPIHDGEVIGRAVLRIWPPSQIHLIR